VSAMPTLRKVERREQDDRPQQPPLKSHDAEFWMQVREGLMLVIRAIEKRHLPDVSKKT
jgi:hypothetical protein